MWPGLGRRRSGGGERLLHVVDNGVVAVMGQRVRLHVGELSDDCLEAQIWLFYTVISHPTKVHHQSPKHYQDLVQTNSPSDVVSDGSDSIENGDIADRSCGADRVDTVLVVVSELERFIAYYS
jgi:hypothetical protein